MNAKTFGLAGLWAVTAIIAAVAIAKLNQTRAVNQQLRADLQAHMEMAAAERSRPEETASASRFTRNEKMELMQLRNEVTQLKSSLAASREAVKNALENRDAAVRRSATEDANGGKDNFNIAEVRFRGYASPENGYISAVAAMKEGDVQTMLNSMTPEEAARWQSLNEGKSEEEIRARFMKEFGSNSTIRIKGQEQVSPTEVVLDVEMERPFTKRVRMNLVGNEWKAGAPINQNKQAAVNQVAANGQGEEYDPLAFYRKNPELMKRYFPHLVQQQQPGAGGGAGTLPPEPAPQQ